MRLVDPIQHRTAVTESADAVLGRRGEWRIDQKPASSLLGRRDSRRELRRRSTSRKPPEGVGGEELGVGLLEFRNGIELRRRRFDGVLVMVADGSTCLLLDRGRASVMV